MKFLYKRYFLNKALLKGEGGGISLTGLIHNLFIKTGALVLAVSLWFYVAGEETVKTDLKIPVHLMLARHMVATEQKTEVINIIVSGRKELIARLKGEELVCKIDFTGYIKPQTIVYSIERKYIPLAPEITILQTRPEHIEVKIDKQVQKVMPIKVVTYGEPAEGYTVSGFMIDPVSAIVNGPESYLKDMIYIDTEPVDVTGRQKSFRKMTPLVSIPMVGEKTPPRFIEVVVMIEEGSKSRIQPRK